jgi:hypothetical protein
MMPLIAPAVRLVLEPSVLVCAITVRLKFTGWSDARLNAFYEHSHRLYSIPIRVIYDMSGRKYGRLYARQQPPPRKTANHLPIGRAIWGYCGEARSGRSVLTDIIASW